MPFKLTAWAIEDFAGFSGGVTTSTVPGPFTSDTVTLDPAAQSGALRIDDDDNLFEDAFIETGGDTTLSDDFSLPTAAGGAIDLPAGTRLENEFELTTDDTPPITFYFVRLGGAGSNDGSNLLVVTTADLTPGQTYTFNSGADGPAVGYDTIICFGDGAMISAPGGDRPVEALSPGDRVLTSDGRCKSIRWIGRRHISEGELNAAPALRPIRIRKGALGPGAPSADLLVSPQHRIALSGREVSLMVGDYRALAPAASLLSLDGVEVAVDLPTVTYSHFLLDAHELVLANGVEAETLLPGKEALRAVNRAAAEEIRRILGSAPDQTPPCPAPAAPILKAFEARSILAHMNGSANGR